MRQATEILLNVAEVTHQSLGDSYEFILNRDLAIVECIRIASMHQGTVFPVKNPAQALDGMLFELNHVRVNPSLDNQDMIEALTGALAHIGVDVRNRTNPDSMSMCYRPLGEITDNVRMYLGPQGKLVFLSPASNKLRVIH